MDRELQKFFKPAKLIRLSKKEHLAGYRELLKFIEEYSLPHVRESVFQRHIYMFVSLAVFLLVSTTGVAVAAENSLPGDLLFPVKTEITEPARLLFAASTKGDVESLKVKFANRRLDETEELASQGKLTLVAAQGKMTASLNKIQEVEKYIQNKKDKGGTEATVDAEAKLGIAKQLLIDGQQKIKEGTYSEAFFKFKEAERIAQEAKLLIKQKNELEINMEQKNKNEDKDEKEQGENKQEGMGQDNNVKVKGTSKTEVEIDTKKDEGNSPENKQGVKVKEEGGMKLELKLPRLLRE